MLLEFCSELLNLVFEVFNDFFHVLFAVVVASVDVLIHFLLHLAQLLLTDLGINQPPHAMYLLVKLTTVKCLLDYSRLDLCLSKSGFLR